MVELSEYRKVHFKKSGLINDNNNRCIHDNFINNKNNPRHCFMFTLKIPIILFSFPFSTNPKSLRNILNSEIKA